MKCKNILEAVKEATKQKTVSLWDFEVTFTPVIAKEICGDGKQLLRIYCLGFRPLYWLIRIDSKIDVKFDTDFDVDKYVEILEEEFGRVEEDELDSKKSNKDFYPQLYWDGGLWDSLYIEN